MSADLILIKYIIDSFIPARRIDLIFLSIRVVVVLGVVTPARLRAWWRTSAIVPKRLCSTER